MSALWILGLLAVALALLTAGSLLHGKAWWIRGLDFPRLQFAALGLLLIVPAVALLDLGRPAAWA